MRFSLFALAILVIAAAVFAQFAYIKTLDGTSPNRIDSRTSYNFSRPVGLEYKDGQLYVSDFDKGFVYIMSVENNSVLNRAGVPGDDPTSLQGPMRMQFDSDGLYIADRAAGAVKLYTGTISLLLVGGGTGSLNMPTAVAADSSYVYVIETGSSTIRRLNKPYYTLNTTFSSPGSSDGQLSAPEDLQVAGDRIYIANTGNDRIEVLNKDFTYSQTMGRGLGGVSLKGPRGLYFDAASANTYVADTNNHRIVVFNSRGYPVATLGTSGVSGNGNYSFSQPYDVLVVDGKLFVSDYGNRRVQVFSIGQFTVNATVLEKINAANQTVSEILSLIPVAQKLGIEVSTSSQFDIESAYDALDRRDYGEAESKAKKASDEAKAKLLFAKQEIAVAAKGLAAKAAERISPYEGGAAGTALASDFTSIKNKAADVSGKIERQEYLAATELALSLGGLVDEFMQKVAGQKAGQQQVQSQLAAEDLRAAHNGIRTRLADFVEKAKKYGQDESGESVSSILGYALEDIDKGKLQLANESLLQAESRLAALEAGLDEKAGGIEAAQEKIASVKGRVAELEGQKVLLYPDFSSSRSLLRDAEASVYERPEAASSMAEEALSLAAQASSNAKTLSFAIIGAAVVFGLALIAGGFLAWKMFLAPRRK